MDSAFYVTPTETTTKAGEDVYFKYGSDYYDYSAYTVGASTSYPLPAGFTITEAAEGDVTISVASNVSSGDYEFKLNANVSGYFFASGLITVTVEAINPEITVATEEKWFKAGDTVTIAGTITDNGGTGIKSLNLTGIGATPIALEYDKNYNWSYTYTGADTKGTALTFTVTDNNDKTAEAAYNLKVDTVAPTLKFYFTEPTYKDTETGINWYKKSTAATTFTASATDATSGVASITHDGTESEGYAWSTDIDCSKETAVPVTIKAYATDNAGNSCEEQSFTYCVDGTGPAITVSQSPVVSQGFFSVCVTASAEDAGSGVDYIEYQIGGGSWTLYDAEEGVVVDDTTTINFRAYDKLGNVNFESYTMTRPAGAIVIDGEVDDAIQYARISEDRTPITIQNDGVLVVNDTVDALNTDSLTLIAGGKLSVNGTFNAPALTVQGTENFVSGNLVEFSTVALAAGSEVTINRTQYEYLLTNADFTESTDGKLIVTPVTGKSLRVADIDVLMNKTNLAGVDFQQDLIDINKLDFKSTKATFIGLKDAYGTTAGDTIRFRKNTEITLGAAGREINLEEGNNTIQIDQAATVAVKSNLLNVSTVKVDKLSKAEFADITFADGRSAKFTAESLSTVSAGNITSGDKALTINVKYGKDEQNTYFSAGSITGSAKADTFDFGTYTTVAASDIALGDGNDQLKVAKNSSFTAGNLDFGNGKDILTINSCSEVEVGDITGVNKLALNNGNYDKKTDETVKTSLTAGAITGTEYSDAFVFGKYTAITAGSIQLGDGDDRIVLGDWSTLNIDGDLDLGSGKNALTLGNLTTTEITGKLLGVNRLSLEQGSWEPSTGKVFSYAALTAESISGTDYADTIEMDNYASLLTAKIALGDGNDQIKIGKDSAFRVDGSVDLGSGKNSFAVNSRSNVSINSDLTGVNQLALGNGSYDKKTGETRKTEFRAVNLAGTEYNDAFAFGNYSSTGVRNIVLGSGNDQIKIGNDAYFCVAEAVDFGTGKNQVEIGDRSDVTMRSASGEFVTKLAVGKDSKVYLSSELYDAVTKVNKTAKVYDLGSFDVAKNFTSEAMELSDNQFGTASELSAFGYNGWMSDSLDAVDYLKNLSGSEMTADFGEVFSSVQYSNDGINWNELTVSTLAIADGATVGFKLKDEAEGAIKYTVSVLDI